MSIGYTINTRPYERKSNNIIEIINEAFIFISGYFVFIFSEWIYDPTPNDIGDYEHEPTARYNFGYVYLVSLYLTIFFNLSIIVYDTLI